MANKKVITKEVEENGVKEQTIDVEQIKIEVSAFAKNQVIAEAENEFKRLNNKYIKEKKWKIIRLRIIILLLIIGYLITIGFLVHDHYFDKYLRKGEELITDIRKENEPISKEEEERRKEEAARKKEEEARKKEEEARRLEEEKRLKEEEEQRQSELREKYKDIFNRLTITLGNEYLDDYYNDVYTNKLLLSIAAEYINKDDVIKDEEYYILDKEVLEDITSEIFGIEVEPESFKYNDISFNYVKSLGYYILNKNYSKNEIEIQKKIIKIEENSHVKVETREYYVENGEVHIPSNKKLICVEKDLESKIDVLEKKLYSFTDTDEGYVLVVRDE